MRRNYFIPLAASAVALVLLGAGCNNAIKLKEEAKVKIETEGIAEPSTSSIVEQHAEESAKIEVKNQALANDKIMINEVYAPKQGWIVIHQVVNGKAGMVIGEKTVVKGENKTLVVPVDKTKVTTELIAMLHIDVGVIGTYEPGSDVPLTDTTGAVIMTKFALVNFAKVEAEEKKLSSTSENKPTPPLEVKLKADVKAEFGASALKEFIMTAKQWEFNPSMIGVNKGDKVRLKITSTDVTHSFSLPDFNVNLNLEPDQTKIAEFVADKIGTFTFACSVFCGDGHTKMKGTLVVK